MKASHLLLAHALLQLLLTVTAVPALAHPPGNAYLDEETLAKRRIERFSPQGLNTLRQSASTVRLKRQIQHTSFANSEPSPAMKAAKARWDNARKPKPRAQQIHPRPSNTIPPGDPEIRKVAIQAINELMTTPDHPLLLTTSCPLCAAGNAPINHNCTAAKREHLLNIHRSILGIHPQPTKISQRDFDQWWKRNEKLMKHGQPPMEAPWAGRPFEITP